MNFFRIASKSKLTALVALAASGVLLGACDSTVEGGGSGGEEPTESSAVGNSQGGSDTGVGGSGGDGTSSVSSAAGGSGPGSATAIALYGYQLPDGGGDTTVSVGVGAGGAGPGSGSVVAVGVGAGGSGEGGWSTTGGSDTSVGGAPSESGAGGASESSVVVVGSGVGGSGEGGYGTSDVGSGVGGSSGEGGYGSSGVGGGGPSWDPDQLFLFISDDILECADPYGVDDYCGPRQFRAQIGLPVEYQQVGVYSLIDPAINATYSAWEGNGQECMGEGGSFFDGTIEVLSIDQYEIRVRLSGTSPADVDGEHRVIRCSSAPPSEESSVLAFYPSDLPPPDGESTVTGVGGGGPGEENLIIDFADHAQVCADPYGDQPGPGQTFHSLSIHLPPSYLQPGTYSLSDPAIMTIQTEMSENTGAVGGGPGGEPGTLTIFEVTDSYIDLQLEGSQHDYANGAGQVPRCN